MVHKSWFILPPAQARYYKQNNADYQEPPAFLSYCNPEKGEMMEMIYPRQAAKVYIPLEIDGHPGRVVFEAAHQNASAKIYWHLNDNFVGTTQRVHKMGLYPATGKHRLHLVDQFGRELQVNFEVMNKTRM